MLRRLRYRLVRAYRRYGTAYYCPLCERHARAFAPNPPGPGQATIDHYRIVSMGARAHYRCPWCNSSDKERLVWRFLETRTDILDPRAPARVLHVAPEKGVSRRVRALTHVEYVSGDKFEGDARYTPQRYEGAHYLDITDLSSLADDRFDLVICNHVLEHVPDDRRALRELFRVTKPGGIAILQVPVSRDTATIEDPAATAEERLRTFGQRDHVRIYGEADYLARLADAGFAVRKIPAHDIGALRDCRRMGFNADEALYACTKPGGTATD
jgi:SAM-dependent methyltransferase